MIKNFLRIAVFALPLMAVVTVNEGPLPNCLGTDCGGNAVPTIVIPQN